MRRFLVAHTSAALVAVIALLAVGGGYVIASSRGTIHACVQKGSGVLYVGKCKKKDKKLIWNAVGPQGPAGRDGATGPAGALGPQGPGATKLLYDGSGTASAPTTTVGTMGPWTLTAQCSQPAAGTTTLALFVTGPAGKLDGLEVVGAAARGVSTSFPAISNVSLFGNVTSTSAIATVATLDTLWIPESGTSVTTLVTAAATGGATNTCHASAVVTPTS